MPKKFRSEVELFKMVPGDMIRHRGTGDVYIVVETTGRELVVNKTMLATNPEEWEAVVVQGKRV